MNLNGHENKHMASGFLQFMRWGFDLNETQQNRADLKVELWHRASCTLYFEVAPQQTSKLSYGIGLLLIYDWKSTATELKVELRHRASCNL